MKNINRAREKLSNYSNDFILERFLLSQSHISGVFEYFDISVQIIFQSDDQYILYRIEEVDHLPCVVLEVRCTLVISCWAVPEFLSAAVEEHSRIEEGESVT